MRFLFIKMTLNILVNIASKAQDGSEFSYDKMSPTFCLSRLDVTLDFFQLLWRAISRWFPMLGTSHYWPQFFFN